MSKIKRTKQIKSQIARNIQLNKKIIVYYTARNTKSARVSLTKEPKQRSLKQDKMVTLEREVSEIIQDLPEKSKSELANECSEKIKNSKPESLENLLMVLSKFFTKKAEQIETDWEYKTNLTIEELETTNKEVAKLTEKLKRLLRLNLEDEEKDKCQQRNLIESTEILIESFEMYTDVISDTINSKVLENELIELRSKPLDSCKIKRAKEILLFPEYSE